MGLLAMATNLLPWITAVAVRPACFWEFRLSSGCKDLRGGREEGGSGRNAPAMASADKEGSPPFPFPPPGESRGGRVPPTPPKAGGSPHKRGFQNAPLKPPLWIPPRLAGPCTPKAWLSIQ
jgi:hypothetical protein